MHKRECTDLIKRTQQFIDKDNSEINGTKGPEGAFENIYDPNSAQDYLRTLLNDAQREIQVLLSPMAIEFIIKKKGIYDQLLDKAKQPNIRFRALLPYDKATDPVISKLIEDSKYTIKIQYMRKWYKPNQIVLLADNKQVLNLILGINDSTEEIKYAMYSNKESVVLCYISMIEYQSLMSEI